MRETVAPRSTSRPVVLAIVAIAMVLAGTLWLWAQYGTAVFFETIRAGFVACFG
jgi:phosphate/sulfate permease